jgi:integrase
MSCQRACRGRPPLPVGTHGRIDFHHASSGKLRARVRLRDVDGALRPLTRWGATEVDAYARLMVAVRERSWRGDQEIGAATPLASAVTTWLQELDESGLAVSTRQLHWAAARLYLVPTLGSLRFGELSVAGIERALASILSAHGPQCARAARRALSSLCQCAIRHGALPVNPVHDTRPIACPRKRVRALSVGEAADLLRRLRADATAVRLDLPDFVEFMLGTGARICEAAAVREAVLDLDAGTVHINATVVRVNGIGLQIQPRTKTTGSERILHVPPHLAMNAQAPASERPPTRPGRGDLHLAHRAHPRPF